MLDSFTTLYKLVVSKFPSTCLGKLLGKSRCVVDFSYTESILKGELVYTSVEFHLLDNNTNNEAVYVEGFEKLPANEKSSDGFIRSFSIFLPEFRILLIVARLKTPIILYTTIILIIRRNNTKKTPHTY